MSLLITLSSRYLFAIWREGDKMLGEFVKFTPSIVSEDSPIRIRARFSAT